MQVRFAELHRSRHWSGADGQYGDSLALLTGDLAFAVAYRLAAGLPRAVLPVWTTLVTELVAGQYLDVTGASTQRQVTFNSRSDHTTQVRALHRYGPNASGRRTQRRRFAHDADAGLVTWSVRPSNFATMCLASSGDPASTGKPVGDDLRSGKSTLLIVEAQRRAGRRERHLLERIGSADLTSD